MKNNYEFYSPTKIVSGNTFVERYLGFETKQLGIKNALLITGPVISKLGLKDYAIKSLEKENISVGFVFKDIPNDSSTKVVNDICVIYYKNKCDGIVALGGGSVLDTAKAVRLLVSQQKDEIEELFGYNMSKIGIKVPLIAIPTTCGTGSEVTRVSVISDEINGVKEEIISDILLPDITILDGKMLETLPKKVYCLLLLMRLPMQ